MANLFDLIEDTRVVSNDTWRPEAPPCLSGIHEIYLNWETSGLRWWESDLPIACSVYAGDRSWYLPWGHSGGGNLSESVVYEWAQRELPGKHITNINTRFEIHMGRVWGEKRGNGGLDFERMGCTVSDVGHYAALLDDHRLYMNLDSIIQDYLHETPMQRLDESRMASYSAGAAQARSRYNVESVKRLKEVMWPLLDIQNLQRVRALEDKVIYVTAEMEKNGAPIDIELLDRWIKESQQELNKLLWKIAQEVGFQVNPDSPKDQERVFRKLGLPITRTKPTEHKPDGNPSFTDEILKRINHPIIIDMRRAGALASLRSKYLVNTRNSIDSNGILRYSLHQLRAAKDENAEAGETGTVTGRYSSTKPVADAGCNIQQRMKATKQRVKFGYDEDDDSHDDEIFLIRKLHIAAKGQSVLSSDMDQAQYRIFAHFVNNPRVIKAYQDNPSLSFHKFMWNLLRPYATLTYRQQKDLNFAVIFGAGLTKMSLMMGHITQAEFEFIRSHKQWDHLKLKLTKEVKRIYDREIPEVKGLLERWSHLAKPKCDDRCKIGDFLHQHFKHQGHVETYLGRRGRFPDGNRLHKAFNFTDQGTEADYNKTKLVELYEQRKELGFTIRITNHDEVVGDIPDLESAHRVNKVLNTQSFQLRVPLTWGTAVGPNWADGEDLK
jgi:DNA polymerase I-like protein with 3'-5' exonuclease and polymerase domains